MATRPLVCFDARTPGPQLGIPVLPALLERQQEQRRRGRSGWIKIAMSQSLCAATHGWTVFPRSALAADVCQSALAMAIGAVNPRTTDVVAGAEWARVIRVCACCVLYRHSGGSARCVPVSPAIYYTRTPRHLPQRAASSARTARARSTTSMLEKGGGCRKHGAVRCTLFHVHAPKRRGRRPA